MNKRYIDFVPKQVNKSGTPGVVRPVAYSSNMQNQHIVSKPTPKNVDDFEMTEIFEERVEVKKTLRPDNFAGKFAQTTVEKRPLGTTNFMSAAAAKAKKIPKISLMAKRKAPVTPEAKPKVASSDKIMQEALTSASNLDDKKMQLPKVQFVKTTVEKRPLSRNVYQPKKIIEPKEEPQGTITIIDKPEKDSRVALIVTIIITIILGAASGTVAFLLLPK